MNKQWKSFDSYFKKQLKKPKFRREYEKLQPERVLFRKIMEARIKKDMTQKKLAAKLNTKQSVISRLETGNGNPSLQFMKRLARAFDSVLEINFRPLAN